VLEKGAKTTTNNATNNARNTELNEFVHNLIVGIIGGIVGSFGGPWIKARFYSRPRLDSKPPIRSSGDAERTGS
jgi:uncharacterized membrane protein